MLVQYRISSIMYKCSSELVPNVLKQSLLLINLSIQTILIILGSATVSILLEETMNYHIELLLFKVYIYGILS